MPRIDPLNNRGPAIGGGRNTTTTTGKCKTCSGAAKIDTLLLTSETESSRLWRHVTFGTMTCIGMCEGYLNLGLPGDPTPELVAMRDRLNNIILKIEERNNETAAAIDGSPSDANPSSDPSGVASVGDGGSEQQGS
jgi:hypothetical protein